ncbi:hypothetical protein LXA43DRAFT_895320 [Ganoderma leucocontextum]|nr:hypothetical protein LXA43DRAFT_895320 [Ganoderma leucocontextum]
MCFNDRALSISILLRSNQPTRHIESPADLVAFVNDVHQHPAMVFSLDTLVITLDGPYPVDALREALFAAVQLEDLILLLPTNDTPDNILNGLHFAHLELFKTNLPHRYVTPFLLQQPSLISLCLGSCGREHGEPCPLQVHNLSHVVTAEYPVSCIAGIAHPKLLRLTVEGGCHLYNTPTSLRSIRPFPSLFALTLDFFPDDYDILESVVRVAPRLQKLKLIENHRAYVRPFSGQLSWSRSLFQLEHLEDLSLRTSATFLPPPLALSAEAAAILKWVSRKRRNAQPGKALQDHPTLSFIRIWYHRRAPGNGIITTWSKSTGTWQNIVRTIAPPLGTAF